MLNSQVNINNRNRTEIDPFLQPVAKAKPDRARVMVSKPLPGTAGQKGKGEIYHEGFVDGKLFLVPDNNLEAMKDIVNFKMRPRKSIRYKHQTSFEISGYDHFKERLDELLEKIDEIEVENSTSEKFEEEPETAEMYDHEKKSDSVEENKLEKQPLLFEPGEQLKYEDDKVPQDDVKCCEENKESISKENKEIIPEEKTIAQKVLPVELKLSKPERDFNYLRFLVSGHFKRDHKPIYIIQTYENEPYLFNEHEADVFSVKKGCNVDIVIAGKFYSKNIMEESEGKPIALNIEPNKILLNEDKILVFENYLENIFHIKNYNVLIKGEFIKSKSTRRFTPFISLGIQNKDDKSTDNTGGEGIHNNKNHTTVLIHELKHCNPYSQNRGQGENTEKSSNESQSQQKYLSERNSTKLSNHPKSPQTNTQLLMKKSITDNNFYEQNDKIQLEETKNVVKRFGLFYYLKGNSLYKTLFTKNKNEDINNKNERGQQHILPSKEVSNHLNKMVKSLSEENLMRNTLIPLKPNSKEKSRIIRMKSTIKAIKPQNKS